MEKSQVKERGKLKMESARQNGLDRRREEYSAKNKDARRSARDDKRTWMENKGVAAEKAAESSRNKELCSIMKTTAGERKRQSAGVKDKQGAPEDRNTRKSAEMG